ncbi:hypothetical protein [Desulfovibrio sp.]|uniref:hypothetical protein n=1 Tax=Desulfovibrio sp. TaxID=885 RepID=UPI0025C52CAA|nr:hypothetical protein [Desulfovibrio sp.]
MTWIISGDILITVEENFFPCHDACHAKSCVAGHAYFSLNIAQEKIRAALFYGSLIHGNEPPVTAAAVVAKFIKGSV